MKLAKALLIFILENFIRYFFSKSFTKKLTKLTKESIFIKIILLEAIF